MGGLHLVDFPVEKIGFHAGVFPGPDAASARPAERYEGRAGESRHGGKQRGNFQGDPNAVAGADHRAEACALG